MRHLLIGMLALMSVQYNALSQQERNWSFNNITVDAGAPESTVTCGTFDALGRFWIGTSGGLFCYDGYTFKSFLNDPGDTLSIPNNLVHDLAFLNADTLLVATRTGLALFSLKTGRFQNLTRPGIFHGEALPDRPWSLLVDGTNACWVTSVQGLYHLHFDSMTVKHWLPVEEPMTRWEGSFNALGSIVNSSLDSNLLWISAISSPMSFHKVTHQFTFYQEDPDYNGDDVDEMSSRFPAIAVMHVDGNEGIWMSTMGQGLKYASPNGGPWSVFELSNEGSLLDAHNFLPDVIQWDRNTLLVASRTLGLVSFDMTSKAFTNFEHHPNNAASILPLGCSALEKDSSGRLWAMMYTGISCYDPHTNLFQPHPSQMGSWPYFSSIAFDQKNQMLFGGKVSGIYGYDVRNEALILPDRIFDDHDPLPFPAVTSVIVRNNGEVWVGGSQTNKKGPPGIYQYHWKEQRVELIISEDDPSGFPLQNITALYEDSKQRVWVGPQYLHPVCLDGDQVIVIDSLDVIDLWDFVEDTSGGIWIAASDGVARITLDDESCQIYQPCAGRPCFDIMQNAQSVAMDRQGNLWTGTRYNGLVRLSGENWTDVLNLTTADGMPATQVSSVESQGDYLWAGTSDGLVRLHTATLTINCFTAKDGLKDGVIEGLHFDGSNKLYVGTRSGLHVMDLDSLESRINDVPPRLYVTSFSVNGAENTDGITGNNFDGYTLNYPLNSFQIEYAGVNLTHPEDHTYAYLLEGNDEEWTAAGNRRFTAYNNLDPGQYTLRVKAANNHGFWTQTGMTLPIYIRPAYWQTTWFKAVLGILLATLLYAGYRYRIHQIRRESQLVLEFNKKLADAESQALRAQMNPHFIFNALNSIKLYVLNRNPEKGGVYLDAFARLVRSVLQNSKEQLISLEKELEALDLYIGLEKLRFDEAFDHEIRIDENLDTDFYLVPPLILQPYVENAIWHGMMSSPRKGKLLIAARMDHDKLLIDIEDNGIGRTKSSLLKTTNAPYKKSMGMEITKGRMELQKQLVGMEINVEIHDLTDHQGLGIGTRVSLEMAYG